MTRWCGLRIIATNVRFSICHNLKIPSRESIEVGVVKALSLAGVAKTPDLHFVLDKISICVIVGSLDAILYAQI